MVAQGGQAGVEVPKDVQMYVSALIEEIGVVDAAKQLEVSRETLVRLRTGDRVRKGTLFMVRQAMETAKVR